MLIECRNLSYSYGENSPKILDGVDLTISEGEFIAIIGANGSGKSTLARHFNALLLPTEGSCTVNGMATNDKANLIAIRRTVGMVFQNPDNQLVGAVVEDDVAFGPENLGVPTAEIQERVTEALAAVEMLDFRESSPHLLSGGQKQRVAIAGALAMQPKILVLDEPGAYLDPAGRRKIMDILASLRASGVTIILITHFMTEAAAADRLLVLDKGRIVLDGTPREVFAAKLKGLVLPPALELARAVGLQEVLLTKSELVEHLAKNYATK